MLPGFKLKLEEMLDRRAKGWEEIKRLENEMEQLKTSSDALDDFLSFLSLEVESAYKKVMDAKQLEITQHPVYGTDIIEVGCRAINNNRNGEKRWLEELSEILKKEEKSAVHYDVALTLIALTEHMLKNSIKYKTYLDPAFAVLCQEEDSDIYYAQWGKLLYGVFVNAVFDMDQEICEQACRKAYATFQKVKGYVEGIEEYRDYKEGDEKTEYQLLKWNRGRYPSDEAVIRSLLEASGQATRSHIKHLRSLVLKEVFRKLGQKQKPLGDLKQGILECADSFDINVGELIKKHEDALHAQLQQGNLKRAQSYLANEKYVAVLPEKYHCIPLEKSRSRLEKYFDAQMETLQTVVDDSCLDGLVKQCVIDKKSEWEQVLANYRKDKAVSDYTEKMEKKIAEGPHADVADLLRRYCTSQNVLKEVKQLSEEKKWDGVVPDKLVKQYYDTAVQEYEKKCREEREFLSIYISSKQYVSALKKKRLKLIDTSKYEDALKQYLEEILNAEKGRIIDCTLLFAEATEQFVNATSDKFEAWQEEAVRSSSLRYFEQAMEKRLAEYYEDSDKYPCQVYKSLEKFRDAVKPDYMSEKVQNEIAEEAWKKKWDGVVPQLVISRYGDAVLDRHKKALIERGILTPEGTLPSVKERAKRTWGIAKIIIILAIFCLPWVFALGSGIWKGITHVYDTYISEDAENDDELWKKKIRKIAKQSIEKSSHATDESEFSYEIYSEHDFKFVKITKYNGTEESVEIPAVIDGKKVGCIGKEAFADNFYLREVVLPDTVYKIETRAFCGCKALEEVEFSKNLTYIEDQAFYACSALREVQCEGELSSLRVIKANAFADCTSLEEVDIASGIYSEVAVGDAAFIRCSTLKKVDISGGEMETLRIGSSTFRECAALETVKFKGQELENVYIGEECFLSCSSLEDISGTSKVKEIGYRAFAGCANLQSISLPKIQMIPEQAFSGCSSLASFEVSDTVCVIGALAFNNCTSLASVEFEPKMLGAEEDGYLIGKSAFYNTTVTEVEIPGSYGTIEEGAFGDCPNLTKFTWRNSGKNTKNQAMGENVFTGSYALKEIYLPRTLGRLGDQDLNRMGNITIYAVEGSMGHSFAEHKNVAWKAWTE